MERRVRGSFSIPYRCCNRGCCKRESALRVVAIMLALLASAPCLAFADTYLYRLECWPDYPIQVHTDPSGSRSRVQGGSLDGYCSTVLTELIPGATYRIEFTHAWDPSGCPEDYIETSLDGVVLGREHNFLVSECTEDPGPVVEATVDYEFVAASHSAHLRHDMHNGLSGWVRHCLSCYADIHMVGSPPPPYEILSVLPDGVLYTGGQDAAAIAVTVVSNWGESEHLSLDLDLRSSLGQVWHIAGPGFSLGIGDSYSTELTWEVPPVNEPLSFDLSVSLEEGEPASGSSTVMQVGDQGQDPTARGSE